MNKKPFKAGVAKVEITPPLGTAIDGDFVAHYATFIHDPLYSKALIFENGQTTIGIIIVDICAMRRDFIDDVKKIIHTECRINPNNLLIASTHTHGGGSIEDQLLNTCDLSFRKKLTALIVRSVEKAKENMVPAKIAFGNVDVPEHVVCRRYIMKEGYKAYNPVSDGYDRVKTNPMGHENQIEKRTAPVNSNLNFLAVKGSDDRWISVLANYSMHYVGDWKNGTITADYFGVFAEQIQAQLNADENFVGIMSNGTSGDANIFDFVQPDRYPTSDFAKSKVIGSDLAVKVSQCLKNMEWDSNPSLLAMYEELNISTRKPGKDELMSAKETVSQTDYEHLVINGSHTGNDEAIKKLYAREQVLLNEYPDTVLFPVQALKIGSSVIGGLGGEFFAETGLWLNEKSGLKNYFTVCLANDYVGYVPPLHEFSLGGYETWRCRSSFVEESAEANIKDRLLQLITQLS